jgi:hypothetical protein
LITVTVAICRPQSVSPCSLIPDYQKSYPFVRVALRSLWSLPLSASTALDHPWSPQYQAIHGQVLGLRWIRTSMSKRGSSLVVLPQYCLHSLPRPCLASEDFRTTSYILIFSTLPQTLAIQSSSAVFLYYGSEFQSSEAC